MFSLWNHINIRWFNNELVISYWSWFEVQHWVFIYLLNVQCLGFFSTFWHKREYSIHLYMYDDNFHGSICRFNSTFRLIMTNYFDGTSLNPAALWKRISSFAVKRCWINKCIFVVETRTGKLTLAINRDANNETSWAPIFDRNAGMGKCILC